MQRALGEHRERAQRLDLVPEELDAHGLAAGRREDVDDPAAHGDLAALLDAFDPRVARDHELLGEVFYAGLVPRGQADRLRPRLGRRQPVGEPERRRADEPSRRVHVERAEPLAHEMRGRLELGLAANPARGEQPDVLVPEEPAGRLGGVTRGRVVGEEARRAAPRARSRWRRGRAEAAARRPAPTRAAPRTREDARSRRVPAPGRGVRVGPWRQAERTVPPVSIVRVR